MLAIYAAYAGEHNESMAMLRYDGFPIPKEVKTSYSLAKLTSDILCWYEKYNKQTPIRLNPHEGTLFYNLCKKAAARGYSLILVDNYTLMSFD